MNDLMRTTKANAPVECLGMTFPSEDARREHFLGLLAEKLKDPAFRKQEGFPQGTDDAILGLSDPPYYTACPNPWLADFVQHHGTQYQASDEYRKEPFAADVKEGKNASVYNAHSYHTKVPHKAVMRYILHYTRPASPHNFAAIGEKWSRWGIGLMIKAKFLKSRIRSVSRNGCKFLSSGDAIVCSMISLQQLLLSHADSMPESTFLNLNNALKEY
jgi:hypothetical protein